MQLLRTDLLLYKEFLNVFAVDISHICPIKTPIKFVQLNFNDQYDWTSINSAVEFEDNFFKLNSEVLTKILYLPGGTWTLIYLAVVIEESSDSDEPAEERAAEENG